MKLDEITTDIPKYNHIIHWDVDNLPQFVSAPDSMKHMHSFIRAPNGVMGNLYKADVFNSTQNFIAIYERTEDNLDVLKLVWKLGES